MEHGVLLLQAEVDSWPSSHAATPGAVLLAMPSPGLPGASSRQGSGMADELDRSWSDVVRELEGTTQRVSLGSRLRHSLRNTSHMKGGSTSAQAPFQLLVCLHAQTHCRTCYTADACLAVRHVYTGRPL